MALRQLSRTLLATTKGGLPLRGGGGGPVKMAPPPDKPLPLWDEMWYDDGQLHSQPVLDGVGETPFFSQGTALRLLGGAIAVLSGAVWLSSAAAPEPIYVRHQYPAETTAAFDARRVAK